MTLNLFTLSSFIYLQQLKAFSAAIKPWAVNSYARVSPEYNCLFFYAAAEKVEEVKENIRVILALAYLKLGCNSISLWCGLNHQGVYNCDKEFQLPIDMVSTAFPIPTPQTNPQTTNDWISFSAVAAALKVSVEQVEKTIEEQEIPAKRQQGEWGLSKDSAQSLIQSHFQQQVSQAMESIGMQKSTSTQLVVADMPSTLESEQMEANLLPPLQRVADRVSLHNPPASMTLPDGYSVKGTRTRNPVPSAALKEALDALPNAGVEKPNYLERIMLKKADAMQFLSAIASQYNKPQEVLGKLRDEASKLWDEVNSEGSAA